MRPFHVSNNIYLNFKKAFSNVDFIIFEINIFNKHPKIFFLYTVSFSKCIYLCISLFFQQVADWALGTLSMKFTSSSINSLWKITARTGISYIAETKEFWFTIQHQPEFIFLR